MRQRLKALALISPLVLFLTVFFVVPLLTMMVYAVDNPEVRAAFPQTLKSLETWDGTGVPADETAVVFARELDQADRADIANAARRLNYEMPGFRSTLMSTARGLRADSATPSIAHLAKIHPAWGENATWATIKRAGASITPYYLLASVDLRQNSRGEIERALPENRLFIDTMLRTLTISGVVTLICLVLAFPVANLIVTGGKVIAGLMLLCVLLPFWTSLLVRTSAWIVILQREGLLNSMLMKSGLINQPLEMIFNRTGLYIAMVHILLPFMIMPIASVMKGLPPSYMRASASLGASPWTSFRRIYLPLVLPGIGSGCLLTFIIAAGYYVTPTLVGGSADQMLSYFIAFYTNTTLNWGMASALGLLLLGCIFLLYIVLGRLIGIGRLVGMD